MSNWVRPGTAEMIRAAAQPAGFEQYVGSIFRSPDGYTLLMTPQVAPPYLVEWSRAEKDTWIAEHGGDPVATRRREEKELLAKDDRLIAGLRRLYEDAALPVPTARALRGTLNADIDSGRGEG